MKKINLTEYIKKAGVKTSLSLSEREKIEGVLGEYMKMKPERGMELVRPQRGHGISFLTLFVSKKYMPIAFIAALILSISGGVSYAAGGSAPGDLLYPVKVSVNERVEAALAVSTEAKAVIEAKLAERRLKEAAKLASEDKLTASADADLSVRFASHADRAVTNTEKLQKEDESAAISIASSFEGDLAAHEAILTDVNVKGKAEALVKALRAKAEIVSRFRAKAEGEAEVSARAGSAAASASAAAGVRASTTLERKETVRKDVAEKMGASAKIALKETRALFARVSGTLDASVSASISASLREASKNVALGDELYLKADFAGAFHAYQSALVTAKRISVFLSVGANASIRALPPASPAPERGNADSSSDAKNDSAPESRQIFPHIDTSVDADSNTDAGGGSIRSEGSAGVNVGI